MLPFCMILYDLTERQGKQKEHILVDNKIFQNSRLFQKKVINYFQNSEISDYIIVKCKKNI